MWNSDEGQSVSYWQAGEEAPKTDTLPGSVDAEVCIIGGGIAGLTTAYLLAKEGKEVAVIDDGVIGGGETARTTAHLSYAIDDRIYRIVKWHGEKNARLAVESHASAIDKIEEIALSEEIACDFRRLDGFLVAVEGGEDDLDMEIEAAHRLGFSEVEMIGSVPHISGESGRALRFPNQGQFHVLKYISGLAGAIRKNGGRLFSNTRAIEWSGDDLPEIKTADGSTIRAGSLVLATNYPIQSKMFAQLPAYRTYAIGARIEKDAMEPVLIWDTLDPYHFVRTQESNGYDLLIVGGEDHRTGQANDGEERFDRLWNWTKERFPADELMYRWSGQVFETHDGLAFIGRYSDDERNVYLITGDSGMGMTHGTIGGMLVSDLILGRGNPWVEVYDPSRIATQSIAQAVPEMAASTAPYVEWVTGGDVSSVDDLKNGEGAVIREGLKKIALSRRKRRAAYTFRRLHAYGLYRAVQFDRENVGLSMPRLALWLRRPSDQYSGSETALSG